MRSFLAALCVLSLVSSAASAVTLDRRIGKMATVKRDGAEIRQGQKVLATLKKGQKVKIYNVQGNFALVRFTIAGKLRSGYVSLRDLDVPGTDDKAKGHHYKPGQTVIVTSREARLMMGKKVLGTIPEGTRLKIEKVKGNWLGVFAQIAAKRTYGWVNARDVDYPPFEEPESKNAGEKKPAPTIPTGAR